MNLLDIVVIVLAGAAVVAGWETGFLARSLSWIGLGLGVYLGIRMGEFVLHSMSQATETAKLAVLVSIVAGAALVGQGLGLLVGAKVARFTMLGPLRLIDRSAGALLGLLSVVMLLWILTPTLDATTGSVAEQARHSAVIRTINTLLPKPPAGIRKLRSALQGAWLPQVFSNDGPSPNVGGPPAVTSVPASVVAGAQQSTVKVTGVACNMILDGSGFAALAPDLIVTNAHVVAGERSTFVLTPSGLRLRATVVAFDEKRDVAILSVPGLQARDQAEVPLRLGNPTIGDTAVSIGHPGGTNQIVVTPLRVAREYKRALGRDLYDRSATVRDIYVLAANIQQGDSGSPVIGADGRAEGVVFALAPDRPDTGYALATSEVAAVYASTNLQPVSTGPCIDG